MKLGALVGTHIRHLREQAGLTQDGLARACQRIGATDMRDVRIAQIEAGGVAVTVETLWVLASAFAAATERPWRLLELLPDGPDDEAQIAADAVVPTVVLRALLEGTPIPPPSAPPWDEMADPRRAPGWGRADDRAAAALSEHFGAGPEEVLRLATRLWGPGATVTTERDRRAGAGATKQARSQITKTLIQALIDAYEGR